MWNLFNKSRDRFSIDELRFLNEQLHRHVTINDTNKDSMVEVLRSVAELLIWGDQHDCLFFEYFMDNKMLAQFCEILKKDKSSTGVVAVQILQTLNLMIQNFRNETAVYYMFSHEYINGIISYPFNFRNEEQLAYYISFLKTISMKLSPQTVNFLIFENKNGKVEFPLYTEAIRFFHHEETMVRTAVRILTLNVYNVDHPDVRSFVTNPESSAYLRDLAGFVRQQSLKLNGLVSDAALAPTSVSTVGRLESCVSEVVDLLYYCNDVMNAGIEELSLLLAQSLSEMLFEDLLLKSLQTEVPVSQQPSSVNPLTAMYILSRLLHTTTYKPLLANIAGRLAVDPQAPVRRKLQENDHLNGAAVKEGAAIGREDSSAGSEESTSGRATEGMGNQFFSWILGPSDGENGDELSEGGGGEMDGLKSTFWDRILSFLFHENERWVMAALCVILSILRNKFIDDVLLEDLGLPPSTPSQDSLKQGSSHRAKLLDALVAVLCKRSFQHMEAVQQAGWILRQVLPAGQESLLGSQKMTALDEEYRSSKNLILAEMVDCWADLLPKIVEEEWQACRRVLENPAIQNDFLQVLLPVVSHVSTDGDTSSSTLGIRTRKSAKTFVALCQIRELLLVSAIPKQPPFGEWKPPDPSERSGREGLSSLGVTEGQSVPLHPNEVLPCRVAFERGKERDVFFVVASNGPDGLLLLVETHASSRRGVVRVTAPLAGSRPVIDAKHSKWLHLRIRSLQIPGGDVLGREAGMGMALKPRSKKLADGRWTLAFSDEEKAQAARQIVLEELCIQSNAVREILGPLVGQMDAFRIDRSGSGVSVNSE